MKLGYKATRLIDNVRGARLSKALIARDSWTRTELEAHQQRELEALKRHAAAHSPFWRDRLAGGMPPPLDKATLMANFDHAVTDPRLRLARLEEHLAQLRGDDMLDDEYRAMATGGTTGRRGVFVYSRAEWVVGIASFLRVNSFAGLGPLPRRRITTVGATDPLHMTARYAMSVDFGLHRLSRLDARRPLPETVATLNAQPPDQLMGYPSVLALLAEEQATGRLSIDPAVVGTTSEVRTEGMERAIREAWPAARLHNVYGITEAGIIAFDCEHESGMHLLEDVAIFENVDEDGTPVPDGEVGAQMLVTDLVARAQPRLRYAISDCVAITSEPCACGRPYRRLLSVGGRSDDILDLPATAGGTVRVHPLALRSPMAAQANVLQYQIVHEREGLDVLVVPRGGVDGDVVQREAHAALARALADLRAAVPLTVRTVAALPRDEGHGAKVKLVRSNVEPKTPAVA